MNFTNWYKKYKDSSYKWRAKYFQPLLKLLAKWKVTPNQITTWRLLFILPLIYYFYFGNLLGCFIFYVLFWLTDLLDGSLARYLNTSSDKGRFLDSVVDNFMYAVVIAGFIYLLPGSAWLLAANIILELFVQLLATVAKCRTIPSDWLIKVLPDAPYFKTLAHLALFLYFCGVDLINPLFIILNLWLLGAALYYYKLIKA